MGVYLDFSNVGAGLGVLADAISGIRERKQLKKFQATSSIFERIADPRTDSGERQALKQKLADMMEVSPNALDDDISNLAGQMTDYMNENFSRITGSSQGHKYWSDITEKAYETDSLESQYTSLEKLMDNNPQQYNPQAVAFMKELKANGNLKEAHTLASGLAFGSWEKSQAEYNERTARNTPAYEENYERDIAEELDHFMRVGLVKANEMKKLEAAYTGLMSRRGSGAGSKRGGKDDIKDLVDFGVSNLSAIDKEGRSALDALDKARDKRNDILVSASESGLDVVQLQSSTVTEGVSALQLVNMIQARGTEETFQQMREINPDYTREDFDEDVEEHYRNLTTGQRVAASESYIAELAVERELRNVNDYKIAASQTVELAQELLRGEEKNPGTLSELEKTKALTIVNRGNRYISQVDFDQSEIGMGTIGYNAQVAPGAGDTVGTGTKAARLMEGIQEDYAGFRETETGQRIGHAAGTVKQKVDEFLGLASKVAEKSVYGSGAATTPFTLAPKLAKTAKDYIEDKTRIETPEEKRIKSTATTAMKDTVAEVVKDADLRRDFRAQFSGVAGFKRFLDVFYRGITLSESDIRHARREYDKAMGTKK